MLRILSWSSNVGCDKLHNPGFEAFEPKQQASPITDFAVNSALKRKRSPSCDSQSGHRLSLVTQHTNPEGHPTTSLAASWSEASNVKAEYQVPPDLPLTPPPSAMDEQRTADKIVQKSSESRLKQIRQTISTQLSLEILLKHKELRLIDQEIAKCQIALEQLRRCSEIPFPATQGPSVLVSEGKGAALRKSDDRYPATSPAPWGVTDGPYSRHYAKWLLPDPRFDGGEPQVTYMQNIVDAAVPARSTRGSFVEAGKSLKSRSAVRSVNFKSLPAGYGQQKEKATGPMILKRKSDNTMVKLVCPDCGRLDFGSAQGFINHCRIGHGRSFASHDAAAEACGDPVTANDNVTVKSSEPVVTPVAGNTHPLIRSAKSFANAFAQTPVSSMVLDPHSARDKKTRSSENPQDFQPSTQTPHLSALVKHQGLGLNLAELVTDAKTKTEMVESDHEDDEMLIDSPLPRNTSRHPQVAGSKQLTKPGSSKRCFSSTSGGDANLSHDTVLGTSDRSSHIDFINPILPSPTNESTQAPSLVDDDEEFEPQSPPSSDEIDDQEIDFDIQDYEHGDRTVIRGGDIPLSHATCNPTPQTRPQAQQTSLSGRPFSSLDENRNASFAQTGFHQETNDRKRRKFEHH